jgi:DNA-binding LacI/PurR family transcriptional regulator
VRLPHEEMGRIAIGALLDAIGGEAQQAQTVAVPCELLVRASTAG